MFISVLNYWPAWFGFPDRKHKYCWLGKKNSCSNTQLQYKVGSNVSLIILVYVHWKVINITAFCLLLAPPSEDICQSDHDMRGNSAFQIEFFINQVEGWWHQNNQIFPFPHHSILISPFVDGEHPYFP